MSVKRGNYRYNGFKLEPEKDERVEALSQKFGLPKADLFRRLVDFGLPAFERSNRLPALRTEQQDKAEK